MKDTACNIRLGGILVEGFTAGPANSNAGWIFVVADECYKEYEGSKGGASLRGYERHFDPDSD